MFREVSRQEYINEVGNLIRNGMYEFESVHNEANDGYKICCIERKTKKLVAFRIKIDGEFKNFVLEDE